MDGETGLDLVARDRLREELGCEVLALLGRDHPSDDVAAEQTCGAHARGVEARGLAARGAAEHRVCDRRNLRLRHSIVNRPRERWYWIATVVSLVGIAGTGILDLVGATEMAQHVTGLGYPAYLRFRGRSDGRVQRTAVWQLPRDQAQRSRAHGRCSRSPTSRAITAAAISGQRRDLTTFAPATEGILKFFASALGADGFTLDLTLVDDTPVRISLADHSDGLPGPIVVRPTNTMPTPGATLDGTVVRSEFRF